MKNLLNVDDIVTRGLLTEKSFNGFDSAVFKKSSVRSAHNS